ncbi:MAG: flavin reductase [Elusimicrobiota bacterium]|nr:flavin reductase [Elusimicrobiota bacterium]
MEYCDNFDKLCEGLEGAGAFLVVENKKGRVNVMTIGWAQAGIIWGEPIMTVFVRPSRYTHSVLESAAHFSVCVPRRGEMKKELAFCGTKSGRDYDKIRACALKLKEGAVKGLKYLDGCGLVYQCEIYGRTDLKRETLSAEALEKYYPGADAPHTLYFGKIIKAEQFK